MPSSNSSSSSDTQGPVFWERLRGLFTREEPERLQGEKRRRVVAVTVCFLVSCVLWIVFTLQDVHTVPIRIPTTVQNGGSGTQALAARPPEAVQAEIEGQGTALLRFFFEEPTLSIGAQEDQVRVTDLVQGLLPGGTTLKSVRPSVLRLQREPRVQRTVPVRLVGEVTTPATHDLMAPPQLQPDSIRISGARSLVSAIDYWPTGPVHVTALKGSLRREVPLADTLNGLIERSTQSVVLQAEAGNFTGGLRQVNVRVVGGPENAVTLDPSSIRVRYRTLVEDAAAVETTDDFYATVSYKQILQDTTGRVRPRLHVPPNLTVRDTVLYPSTLRHYSLVEDE